MVKVVYTVELSASLIFILEMKSCLIIMHNFFLLRQECMSFVFIVREDTKEYTFCILAVLSHKQ